MRQLECLGSLSLGETVHVGFGVFLRAVLDRTGEGDQRLPGISAFGEISVHRQLEPHGMKPRAGHDYRFRPAADLALHLRGKMLDAAPHLLVDRVCAEIDEGFEQVLGLPAIVMRIVLRRLQQPPI